MKRFEFQIGENFHRRRLDEFLFDRFTDYSKAYLRRIVRDELCEVNGFIANTGVELRRDDFIEIRVEVEKAKSMIPQEIPLKIVYEDAEIMVIDKQYGLLVHPTHFERDGTILNGLAYHLNAGRTEGDEFVRPHLVHRLDRETSGLLVVAKTAAASKNLCRQIKKQEFKKGYLALIEGYPPGESGEISAPIGRDEQLKRHQVMKNGKESVSKFWVIDKGKEFTRVSLEPVTGRTNQLRIHCAHFGHPIAGDEVYGARPFRRLCLHASNLTFRHPMSGNQISFESLDADF